MFVPNVKVDTFGLPVNDKLLIAKWPYYTAHDKYISNYRLPTTNLKYYLFEVFCRVSQSNLTSQQLLFIHL